MRVHPHHRLDDLPGTGIDEGRAHRRPALAAVHPLNHVVAGVERIHPLRHVFHPKGVHKARRLEHLVPPAGSLLEGRAVGLGHGRVQVIDDGLDRLAPVSLRILFDETMTNSIAHDVALVERSRIVVEGNGKKSDAGIESAGTKAVIGKGYERVVKPQREAARIGGVSFERFAGPIGHERERGLDFGVFWEGLGAGEMNATPVGIEPVATLICSTQHPDDVDHVAHEKRRRIDQDATRFLPPTHRSERPSKWESSRRRSG